MQDLVTASYQHSYQEEASSLLGEFEVFTQELDECGTESVVRVTLINQGFQQSLMHAIGKMTEARLEIDNFGFNMPNAAAMASGCDEKRLSDKLTILVNDITIVMQRLQYANYRGKIYKRDARSKYTYSYKCEARAFVNTLATNENFKSRLIRDMRKVIELLSDPHCELFQPLVIDYDLIEVKDGVCWSVKRRSFVQSPIEERQVGKVSPRAFCAYDPEKDADPKYFRQILENSLSDSEVATFCEDFLRLLNYNKKKHKDRVPCLVGAANSGKTSLFFPIQGLVHHGNIATVTKQRAFNKAMITPFTEVIFIDEVDEGALDIADWKILTQGGYSAHDVKYQTAKPFMNKCPMLVTAQQELNFGAAHQPAMDRRLRTYHFKSLPHPKKKAAAWLRKNAMECVVWAAEKARCKENSDNDEGSSDSDEESIEESEEGTLKEAEKVAIRAISISIILVEDTAADTVEEEMLDDSSQESGTPNEALAVLRESLERLHPDSLRYRQLRHMLCEEEQRQSQRLNHAKRQHQSRIASLREKGVSTQSAELLPTNPDSAIPTQLEDELAMLRRKAIEEKQESEKRKAKDAFEGRWLRQTEKELHDCVEKCKNTGDPHLSANMQAYQELLCDKLKLHHQSLGTYNTVEAIEERKRACVELGILREQDRHLVTNVSGPLPTSSQQEGGTQAGTVSGSEDEDRSLFITPLPRAAASSSPSHASSNAYDLAVSEELMRNSTTVRKSTRKRSKRPALSQANQKRPRKTL